MINFLMGYFFGRERVLGRIAAVVWLAVIVLIGFLIGLGLVIFGAA